MKIKTLALSLLLGLLTACSSANTELNSPMNTTSTNQIASDKMLLVLSAPSVYDHYYKKAFQQIVDFQIAYAKKIIGNDNVIIVVDEETKPYYEGKLPEDVLLVDRLDDIWARDFTTINPTQPTQFTYTWASMSKSQSQKVQASFNKFADKYGLERAKTELILDGGNIVDNYAGRVITTTRFLEDNQLTMEQGKNTLRQALHAKEVAILEPDEDVLAHSDGMVSWVEKNTLLINDYSAMPELKKSVMSELKTAFPTAKIVEVPVDYKPNQKGEWAGFESACGVNLNATVTFNNIYVPTFSMEHEARALELIHQHTNKKVIPIDARHVCPMGGSVRCLTWQVIGKNAEKLIRAAREK